WDGRPLLEDGRTAEVANIVWCTGFRPDFGWIDLPVFGADGYPVHSRGVVEGESALYFVGLPFLYSLASSTVGGVGRDGEYIAHQIAGSCRLEHDRISSWTRQPAFETRRLTARDNMFEPGRGMRDPRFLSPGLGSERARDPWRPMTRVPPTQAD